MTQLYSLPTLVVSIAFNPVTPITSATQTTWTDVTAYVRDFSTSAGRQHFLDRIEASRLRMTLDNRSGYFLNQPTSTVGAIIRTRLPIKVTAQVGTNTPSPIFYGFIESVEEQTFDQLNQELLISAVDSTKFLSLLYMNRNQFYGQFVNSTITTSTSSITIATGSKTFTVPTLASIPATGTAVSITAKTVQNLAPIIAVGTVSAGTTSTSLVVNITNTFLTGISSGPYTSWLISIGSDMGYYRLNSGYVTDSILGNDGGLVGGVNTTGNGALLYSSDTALDLSNGGNTANVASFQIPTGYANTVGAIDFWILGQTLTGQNVMAWLDTGFTYFNTIAVAPTGELVNVNGTTGATTHTNINVVDGMWHHIGLYASGGNIYLYCDGTFTQLSTAGGQIQGQGFGLFIGNSVSAGIYYLQPLFPLTGAIAQLTIGAPYSQTSRNNILNRYKAGSLLGDVVSSGDRIAEVLTLSGYGTISAGALVVPNYTVNDVAWSSTNNGTFFVQNIQSSATGSTALDLIQQTVDTDIGAFFQKPDGSFEFDTQAYLYTATNNITPSGAYVWTDVDGGNVTFYEPTSLQILRDDADVWTTVQVTAQNGTTQTYENTGAEPLYAYSTLTKSNVAVTNEQALQSAVFLGNLYQSSLPRIQNMELSSKMNNGANLSQMLNKYLNDQVQVVRNQNGASASGKINSTMVIESIRHDFKAEPGEWVSSFTFDPYPKRFQNLPTPSFYMIFDDTTYGKFDSTNFYL